MKFIPFTLYNIIGGALWVVVLVGGGYYFGNRFPGITEYVHYIIFFFLAITSFTVIKGYFSAKSKIDKED
jgi:membrane-associated protein